MIVPIPFSRYTMIFSLCFFSCYHSCLSPNKEIPHRHNVSQARDDQQELHQDQESQSEDEESDYIPLSLRDEVAVELGCRVESFKSYAHSLNFLYDNKW